MLSKSLKVAAVVVTYNRKELLIRVIDALQHQSYPLMRIYIIDNASTDGTGLFLHQNIKNNAKLVYIKLSQNSGGAGGFHTGMKVAMTEHDWIWLMDDDAIPALDGLARLVTHCETKDIVAVAGCVQNVNGNIQTYHRGYLRPFSFFPFFRSLPVEHYKNCIPIDVSSFVGVMIKSGIAAKIGLPRKDFFIHYDDLEFSIRLRQEGTILLIPASKITHLDVTKTKKLFARRASARISDQNHWLYYFGHRNLVYLGQQYCHKPVFYLLLGLYCLRQISGIVVYDTLKKKRISIFIRAVIDGLKSNFTNLYPLQLKKQIQEFDENTTVKSL